MSKIPYRFFPIPEELLTDAFLEDPDMMKFIRWIFKRISTSKTTIPLKRYRRNLELEPFEFMFGRKKCAMETGLSLKKVQISINQLVGMKYVKKTVSKTVSTFSVYTLVTSSFSKNHGQQDGQQEGQHVGQHVGHNLDNKSIDIKEIIIPNPSSKILPIPTLDLIDDFSSKRRESKAKVQEGTEVYPGVWLPDDVLKDCIEIKGSLEEVKLAVGHIMHSPGRKVDISNWPNALAKWDTREGPKVRFKKNQEMGKRLEREYSNNSGWVCEVYNDRQKDQEGLLFYNLCSVGSGETIFISFMDYDFGKKSSTAIREKKMQKSRMSYEA